MKNWLCGAVLVCAGGASAQEVATWRLNAVGEWSNAANWVAGVVPNNTPGMDFDVTIDSGTTYVTPFANADAFHVRSLSLLPGSQLRVNGGAIHVSSQLHAETSIGVSSGGAFHAAHSRSPLLSSGGTIWASGALSSAVVGGSSIASAISRLLSIGTDSGGRVELPGVRHIDVSAHYTDSIPHLLSAIGVSSRTLLPELRTVSSGNSLLFLEARSGGVLMAPKLKHVEGEVLILVNAHSGIDAPNLASLQGVRLEVTGSQAEFDAEGLDRLEDSSIVVSGGAARVRAPTFRWTPGATGHSPVGVSGPGALLQLGVKVIDLSTAAEEFTIFGMASGNGALLDLERARQVIGPADGVSYLELRGLTTGRLRFGSVSFFDRAGIVLTTDAAAEFTGKLVLNESSFLRTSSSAMNMEGDFLIRSSDPGDFELSEGVFRFVGETPQKFEANAQNLGPSGPALAGQRLGSVVVGADAHASVLRLIDQFDNDAGVEPEAVYFGELTLLNGSTLRLGGLDAYVGEGGESVIHLNALFAPGETRLAFSGGFIEIPSPGPMVLVSLFGACTLKRRR